MRKQERPSPTCRSRNPGLKKGSERIPGFCKGYAHGRCLPSLPPFFFFVYFVYFVFKMHFAFHLQANWAFGRESRSATARLKRSAGVPPVEAASSRIDWHAFGSSRWPTSSSLKNGSGS